MFHDHSRFLFMRRMMVIKAREHMHCSVLALYSIRLRALSNPSLNHLNNKTSTISPGL